ncbi:cytochrome P450 [Neoroseomonas oryzicola]|uniref:Cytochrome P450 n=1 Tax=Neoroseomonas oryzicola TaxID=535904 RepID=A0A9X9WEI6_9PROT|nr:cytochrome P450 [Neoroseomonas oryzicola]MBR0658746.1 cytochrome P450 [Neoroseomonas oryzicola]NKE17224.1 cytochrome P450 [Neoroseomonas oryzicola]
MSATKADFIPPMPTPAAREPTGLAGLMRARRDVLSIFPADAYRRQVFSTRLPGRLILIANAPEVVREVFVTKHETYQRKSRFLEDALRPVVGNSCFIAWGEEWAERREAVSPPIHPSGLAQFHPCFVRAAEETAEDFARADGPVDVAAAFAAGISRVLLLAVFGPDARREEARIIAETFTAYQDAAEVVDLFGLMGLPDVLGWLTRRRAGRLAVALRGRVARLIEAAGPEGGTPLLAALRDARRPDGSRVLTGERLLDEVVMFLLAGAEGAAITLTWTAMLAALHPETADRMAAELPDAAPAYAELPNFAFTRAVIQEAMRLYPPVAVFARQAVKPDRIRRWELDEGDIVLAVPWLLHRHEALWEAPNAFRPDRFLGDAARQRPRFAYLPFGIGPRICAGAAFGMAEVSVFAAILFRRFRFALAPGFVPRPNCRLALRPKGGMRLVVTPR